MATHDYVIANGTGAAVRSDLNNALAAIVSNNSGSSEPSTKYAYQWWADTTTGQLKLRNSANNAWITIFELDGTMLMEDGTLAAPGLAFASDLDTGFSRSAANKINFSTGGAERLEIGSTEVVFNDPSNDVDFRVESNGQTHMLFVDGGNDAVGIGGSTVTDSNLLNIQGTSASSNIGLVLNDTNTSKIYGIQNGGSALKFFDYTASTERIRLDSSGRLLLATSSASGDYKLQVNGVHTGSFVRASGSGGPIVSIKRTRGNTPTVHTIVQNGNGLGTLQWEGADGSTYIPAASIEVGVDGTPGTNDMPGRLVFSTTADGASSPTERLKIDSSGNVKIGSGSTWATSSGGLQLAMNSNDAYITTYFDSHSTTLGAGTSYKNKIRVSGTGADNNISFHVGASGSNERLRLDSSGRLLVGTSSYTGNATIIAHGHSGSSTGPAHVFLKRGNTTPSDGDDLGYLFFSDANTSGGFGAWILGQRDGGTWTSGSSMPGRIVLATTADGASSPTERMRIDSSGNTIQYSGATLERQHRQQSSSAYIGTNIRSIISGAVAELAFDTNSNWTNGNATERMRIQSNGEIRVTNSGNNTNITFVNSGANGTALCYFQTASAELGKIRINGSGVAYDTTSDYRLKENVEPIAGAITRLKELKPLRFNFISNPSATVDGFLAHEVQDIVPEAITGEKDAVKEEEYEITPAVLDDDGNVVTEAEMGTREVPDYQGIDQSKLVPLLTKAIQEQQELINNLTARIEELEN